MFFFSDKWRFSFLNSIKASLVHSSIDVILLAFYSAQHCQVCLEVLFPASHSIEIISL